MQHKWLLLGAILGTTSVVAQGCSADIAEFSYTNAVVAVPALAMPGASIAVQVTAENDGQAAWEPGEVDLVLDAAEGFASATIPLQGATEPGQSGKFVGNIVAPARTGIFKVSLRARYEATSFGDVIVTPPLDVTCSDGVYCNGTERFVAGQCVSGKNPCDDAAACTTDACEEATGTCTHDLAAGCATCMADCTPNCMGRVCGDDGCGGSCGDCMAGEACAAVVGLCQPANQPGSCANPLPLIPVGSPLTGDYLVQGNSTDGLHETTASCNTLTKAAEKIYELTVTQTVALEARLSGFDSVLHVRQENPATPASDCLDNSTLVTVGCSDDASPPGEYGSRLDLSLKPGKYYFIVSGFDASKYGPFDLALRFVAGTCIPHCDGRYCGEDPDCGGSCGACGAMEACVDGRCRPDPCVPMCEGKQCGDDGCGASCGTCAAGSLCVTSTGQCQVFADCNHDTPECKPPCGAGEFCGSDCSCHEAGAAMPDLVLNKNRLSSEIKFDTVDVSEASCSWIEQCVDGLGTRKVMRFSVEALNQGQATLTVPPPPERPDLFTFSACHGHYHFLGFANYSLLDKDGKTVATGRKQAYCMEDTEQIAFGPNIPCTKRYNCEEQGIQAGWSDLYGNTLDCQWLDVTDVPSGDYFLEVSLNPSHSFEETSFTNNSGRVPVTIP